MLELPSFSWENTAATVASVFRDQLWRIEPAGPDKEPMRALITGGAGFIGSHLTDRLLERGDDVLVLDNLVTGRDINLAHAAGHPRLTVLHRDLSKTSWDRNLDGRFDAVFHLASPASPVGYAQHPIETLMANSVGTHHALDLARRDGARIFIASTSEVYGEPLVHPQREDYWGNVNPNGPRACYDEGKRFGEALAMEYFRQYGVDLRIARIFNTYGPRSKPDDGRVVPNFCVQALRNEPITIYGSGQQTRSFCFVSDLVSGFVKMIDTDGLAGEVINLGNPAEITVSQLAEVIIELAGSSSEIVYKPLPADDPTRRQPDIAKARRLLDWEPRVDLREGILATLAYFSEALPLR
jgi:nucleoside-diphosphate-sugar epimerase